MNYREISLFSFPRKVYAKCLKGKWRKIEESKLEDGQCGFCPSRSTKNQIFTLRQIFEKFWEYAKDVFACFVDLKKTYDRVPREKLGKVLQEYSIDGQLFMAIQSLYGQPEVCVCVNSNQSKSFYEDVGLRQRCVLSPLLFIVYMNWMNKLIRTGVCVAIGKCKISRLPFADDLLFLASSESGL